MGGLEFPINISRKINNFFIRINHVLKTALLILYYILAVHVDSKMRNKIFVVTIILGIKSEDNVTTLILPHLKVEKRKKIKKLIKQLLSSTKFTFLLVWLRFF